MNVIETKGLTKKFGAFTALEDVNLTVRAGEIYGFIGPNGAGKSTTIRVLLGMLKATKGTAKIFGLDAWQQPVEIHKRLAYVPGDVNLWPNVTGGEAIDLLLKLRGDFDKQKRDHMIERFQLDPRKKCRTYSKGNRQKVALVAAFASGAELFILDEPTSGLDPLMERIFQEEVLALKEAGKTVLLSSHILSEVERLCDQVGIIRDGQVIESGTLAEMRHLTRTQFVLETKQTIPNLVEQPGIHDIEQKAGTIHFQVDTEYLSEVMAFLAPFEITRLESTPPTLEDLFMRHYEVAGGDA
ncbi:MAG TPA: ABC transporter ATP-binding protein [Candidatus Avamphibacillus intestinigallinarum]|nr:ABC transporter ATP-binding protein [Candidatus Avamphibacillus intestinigallinarum]